MHMFNGLQGNCLGHQNVETSTEVQVELSVF